MTLHAVEPLSFEQRGCSQKSGRIAGWLPAHSAGCSSFEMPASGSVVQPFLQVHEASIGTNRHLALEFRPHFRICACPILSDQVGLDRQDDAEQTLGILIEGMS